MGVLTMQPERVFYYFEEISKIPRGSGNTKQVSDYCVEWAKEQGLKHIQDEKNNVIIFKDGTAGREKEEPIILQGHLDMVCEKNMDCDHDFTKDGIKLIVEGDMIRADRTTLGGDDGIAIAYAMAILESSELSHPPIEAVFTVDEEIGLLGAADLDTSVLKGKRMLNIDSEEEGVLLTSCAGGVSCDCRIPMKYVEVTGMNSMEITITGLQGGHSGAEIHKGRCNANKLMGRLLFTLAQNMPFEVSALSGGLQDNAIPREAKTVLVYDKEYTESLKEAIDTFVNVVKAELGAKEPDLRIEMSEIAQENAIVLSPSSKQLAIFMLMQIPNGVQEMSGEIEGLVETSLNVGIMRLNEELELKFAVRSSIGSAKEALRDKLAYLTEFLGGECVASGSYPAWEFKRDSAFREICIEAYRQVYKKEPKIMALHAGLECGMLADKIEGFDAISMGPDIFDIHTPQEHMSISSVQRTWDYIVKILELA